MVATDTMMVRTDDVMRPSPVSWGLMIVGTDTIMAGTDEALSMFYWD